MWREFIGCMQQQDLAYTERLDTFVNQFIDEQFKVMNKCLHRLEKFINQLSPME